MEKPPDEERGVELVIVGGGIAGLTCAVAAERALPEARITLLEQTVAITPVGAGKLV